MIHSLSRFPKSLLEGFSGVYERPDGTHVSFSLCLYPENSQGKAAKDLKRQTLIEAKNRAAAEGSPQVYTMNANLKPADLSAGIKHALQSGNPSVPVFIEVPNKSFFAQACEALGMSRKSLIELAGSSFVAQPDISQQAYGKFHRVLGDIYDKGHLPSMFFEDHFGTSLKMADPQLYDYTMSVSADIKRALPGAQKYVLQFKDNVSLKHVGGEMGRYFAPQQFTAIEAKVKIGQGAEAFELGYMFMIFPPQFSQGEHDFDVCVLIEQDKEYVLCPVMLKICPTEHLNNVEVDYLPFINQKQIKAINDATNNSFNNMSDQIVMILLSSLEWINSPSTQHVDHQPKQKQLSDIASQFASGGKRPFFKTVEVRIPDAQSSMTPIHHDHINAGSVTRGVMGLQSVTAHWQRYGKDKEWQLKAPFERGNPAHGVSANIGVGGADLKADLK